MYHSHEVLHHPDVLAHARHELELGRYAPENVHPSTGMHAPQIVQLAGNDPAHLVEAARCFEPWADGFDLNLGCPQTRAQRGHYGGYLLHRKDWDQVEACIRALAHSVRVPITAKLRLCDNAPDTPKLAVRLAEAGAQVITLHARHVAPNRRRAGPAKLAFVREVVEALEAHTLHVSQSGGRTAVLSNGNVRCTSDIAANLAFTRADGIMIGEPLLMHPDLFVGGHEAPLSTFLRLSAQYPTAPLVHVQQHVRAMLRGMPPSRETRALADVLLGASDIEGMLYELDRYKGE